MLVSFFYGIPIIMDRERRGNKCITLNKQKTPEDFTTDDHKGKKDWGYPYLSLERSPK